MRHAILLLLFLAAFRSSFAQSNAEEKKAIEAQVDAFIKSWNNHNFDDMKNYVSDTCDWVNSVGMWWKSRDEIQYAHQTYHNDFFKKTPMEKRRVNMRLISADAAIVHLYWYIGAFDAPDGTRRGNDENLATMVFVKKEARWLITAMQLAEVDERAQAFDPVKNRGK